MKKLLKQIITMGLLFCLSAGAAIFADALDNKNAIGMYVIGGESGVGGIQYERRFTDTFSTKFGTFAYLKDKNYYDTKDANFNFIIEPDFTLFQTTWNERVSSRLFAFGLAGYDFQRRTDTIWDGEGYENRHVETKNIHSLIAAAGFGFDFIFFEHLSIPIQFGFLGTINDDNPNIGFCGGLALRYSW